MEDLSSFASIPAIMLICNFLSVVHRWFISEPKKKLDSFDTILCGSVGLVIGIVTYYFNPDVIHSDNVLAAAATGLTSGLASIGLRQKRE